MPVAVTSPSRLIRVIFALKTLTNHYYPNEDAWLLGQFPVPSKYACWIELLVIQVLVPNASFLGHLAGILVGLAFTMSPLKYLMDTVFIDILGQHITHDRQPHENPSHNDHFYEYTGGLSEEEQVRRAMDESSRFKKYQSL
uniref:Peptidase S54 rhomboid domain-containing protein n=1 Tax=Romanomermis culicivorax TaxID=13658 RepID=A0A915KHY7_ROMCU